MCELWQDTQYHSGFCSRKPVAKARKQHKCDECSRVIRPGESYFRFAGTWEGDFWSTRFCATCVKLIDWLQKRGHSWVGDQIREDVRECAAWEIEQKRLALEAAR